jgi:hypothetical protein
MNSSANPTTEGGRPRRRVFLHRLLIVLAWTVTLIALFYAEENWRGRRAWNRYRLQLENKGAQLDLNAFIPKSIPDDQNFAATPFVKSWFLKESMGPGDKLWMDKFSAASSLVNSPSSKKGSRQFLDLGAWAKAFEAVSVGQTNPPQNFKPEELSPRSRSNAWPAILEGLKSSQVHLTELADASHKPFCRYPVVYDLENPWAILLPHLAQIKRTLERLQLEACAELAAAQSDKALEDVNLMLFMTDSIKDEPFLVGFLVRVSSLQMAVQPVWEGLAEHRWSDSELQKLENRFLQYNFFQDLQFPLGAERAAALLTCDLLARGKYTLAMLASPSPETGFGEPPPIAGLLPKGWYGQEKINYCRLSEMELDGTIDPVRKRVSPQQVKAGADLMMRELAGSAGSGKAFKAIVFHHRLIAALLLPALEKVSRKAAEAQTSADQTALACALERYRLAQGHFPEKLEALVPQFVAELPHDVFTGESYKYRRTEDGQFLLYSVGWNEKDDSGMPGKALFDEQQGDWVWSFPAPK